MKKETIVAGLDIGTTKVSVAVGILKENGLEIVGVGNSPSHGLRRGIIVNIESTTEAIRKAKEEAELMSGQIVESVWVGVGGPHIKSFDSKGMVAIRNHETTQEDIQRVIEAAQAVAVPSDRDVLHVLPREYRIDDQDGISDPIGMSGVRLESHVHIVTGGRSADQNVTKCVEKAGLKVSGLVLEQMASSLAVLSEDERKLGAVVVDMGGGSCDLIFYVNGSVAYTAVVPVGGAHVTNDVAVGLRTPQSNAENIKKKYGCALSSLINSGETIEVEGVGGRSTRTVFRQNLCEIIEPRAEEILNYINQEIQKSGLSKTIGSGVVLTGGASQLEGLIELGEFVFDMPVRKGRPEWKKGLTDVVRSPVYSTVVGLIIYGEKQLLLGKKDQSKGLVHQRMSGWVGRLRNLFDGAF